MKKQEKMNKKMGQCTRKARIEKHLTQQQLADLIKSSDSIISYYEQGKIFPGLYNLIKLKKISTESPSISKNSIANIIKYRRHRLLLSILELSDISNLSVDTIYTVETGNNNIQDIIILDDILYKLERKSGIKSKKLIELNLETWEDK